MAIVNTSDDTLQIPLIFQNTTVHSIPHWSTEFLWVVPYIKVPLYSQDSTCIQDKLWGIEMFTIVHGSIICSLWWYHNAWKLMLRWSYSLPLLLYLRQGVEVSELKRSRNNARIMQSASTCTTTTRASLLYYYTLICFIYLDVFI